MSRLLIAVGLSLFFLTATPPSAVAMEFPQAISASALRQAEGEIYDVSEFDAEPHWTFSGRWVLGCGAEACADALLTDIGFDLVLIMLRPDGGLSHTHSFSDFLATSVEVDGDGLFIEGMIVGSGAVGGPTLITLDFIGVSGAGELRLELPGNVHVVGQLGGAVVRSR